MTQKEFLELLTYRRPAGSATEREVIRRFIDSVPGMQQDKFGNRFINIGDSKTMISCHTDTVHSDAGRQRLSVKHGFVSLRNPQAKQWNVAGHLATEPKAKWHRDCLGADDGAGIYTALRMIEAGVPATYVFHREEECGGHGSQWIADNRYDELIHFDHCIAFDRRGTSDIITHQMMGRCCSNDFARALADAIGLGHKPCPFGSFTDSANYTDFIPECTNVSVGYQFEHSSREFLDLEYLETLIDRVCQIDFDTLPTVRDPYEVVDWRTEDKDERDAQDAYEGYIGGPVPLIDKKVSDMTDDEFKEWMKK